jgi:hypothetical protein
MISLSQLLSISIAHVPEARAVFFAVGIVGVRGQERGSSQQSRVVRLGVDAADARAHFKAGHLIR